LLLQRVLLVLRQVQVHQPVLRRQREALQLVRPLQEQVPEQLAQPVPERVLLFCHMR
jgi:hypothetical protein